MFLSSANATGLPLLTLTVCLPALGAAVVALARGRLACLASRVPAARGCLARVASQAPIAIGGLTLLLATALALTYDRHWFGSRPAFQFADPSQGPLLGVPGGIAPQLALDGTGMALVWVTALLGFVALIEQRRRPMDGPGSSAVPILLLQAGLLVAFSALSVSLFLLGWLLALLAGSELVYGHGVPGARRRWLRLASAALLGPGLVAAVALALARVAGSPPDHLLEQLRRPLWATDWQALWLGAFVASFLSPLTLLPVVAWLPRRPAPAPLTALGVALVWLRLQAYGLARFGLPLAPLATLRWQLLLVGLGVVAMAYATWLAARQRELAGRVGWLAVAQTALVVAALAALNPQSLAGGVMQLLSHSLATAAAFLLLGYLGRRESAAGRSGSLSRPMLPAAPFLRFSLLAVAGFPPTGSFVGEWLALLGVFRVELLAGALATLLAAFAIAILVLPLERLSLAPEAATMRHGAMTTAELATVASLVVGILFLGLLPRVALTPIASSCQAWLAMLPAAAMAASP